MANGIPIYTRVKTDPETIPVTNGGAAARNVNPLEPGVYSVTANGDVRVKQGDSTVEATLLSMPLWSRERWYLRIIGEDDGYISAIADGADAVVFIARYEP